MNTAIPGIGPRRSEIIVGGALVYSSAMERFGLKSFRYSSLGLLMSLDVDALKIDRSLLEFDTTRRGSLVMAIAALGHTLGLKVVAEGVETPKHLHRAREACCDAVQGFYLSRPLEEPAVGDFLTTWTAARLGDPDEYAQLAGVPEIEHGSEQRHALDALDAPRWVYGGAEPERSPWRTSGRSWRGSARLSRSPRQVSLWRRCRCRSIRGSG
jgi:hypothetical protein